MEEELHKIRSARAVEDLQRKELEDQLEAESYFSGLYKTQVRELQEEVDEGKSKIEELLIDRNETEAKLNGILMRNEQESMSKALIDQKMGELEKVRKLVLKDKVDPNSAPMFGETPLHWSSQSGHLPVVEELISLGADVRARQLRPARRPTRPRGAGPPPVGLVGAVAVLACGGPRQEELKIALE